MFHFNTGIPKIDNLPVRKWVRCWLIYQQFSVRHDRFKPLTEIFELFIKNQLKGVISSGLHFTTLYGFNKKNNFIKIICSGIRLNCSISKTYLSFPFLFYFYFLNATFNADCNLTFSYYECNALKSPCACVSAYAIAETFCSVYCIWCVCLYSNYILYRIICD